MEFVLVAWERDLFEAWRDVFEGIPGVAVEHGDILGRRGDALVSPANSFGYMDGGLDLKISQYFGWALEDRVRATLLDEWFGEVPVGQALITPTEHELVPFLITAPTMRVPSDVSTTVNAYLAFKAVIQCVLDFNRRAETLRIETVLVPGLGTGEGRLSPRRCAEQMLEAHKVCLGGQILRKGGLASAVRHHLRLLGED